MGTKSTFFALSNFFNSKVLSRRTKVRLYIAIIRPILTYGYKTWIIINTMKRKLRKSENKVRRKCCEPI
ncbi:Reverse transcriptase domain-containing protein [Aphis craccivora]|uniref:Reverse transcriptase domain-containing protein n=1 Tax=Aphis craccivora TaxID=307492 RepID=A0A6G0YQ46_APHCR|nr:Reverse transcriptase domain-containing protein [Aphis craccivora]